MVGTYTLFLFLVTISFYLVKVLNEIKKRSHSQEVAVGSKRVSRNKPILTIPHSAIEKSPYQWSLKDFRNEAVVF